MDEKPRGEKDNERPDFLEPGEFMQTCPDLETAIKLDEIRREAMKVHALGLTGDSSEQMSEEV